MQIRGGRFVVADNIPSQGALPATQIFKQNLQNKERSKHTPFYLDRKHTSDLHDDRW